MKKNILAIALVFTALPAAAAPSINVGSLYEFMEPQQNTLLKRIRNNGTSTAYVRISVSEIVTTAGGRQEEKPVNMEALVRGAGQGLVASPTRMMIPAGGMQANRLLYTGKRDTERLYRVRFVPVVPESGAEFGLNAEESARYRQEMSAGVTVMSGYGAIVTVRPAATRYDTRITSDAPVYSVRNNGNSTIILDTFTECSTGMKNCATPVVHYLRPGASLSRPATAGKSYRFTLVEGTAKKSITFGI